MKMLNIPNGTQMLIAAPAKPMPQAQSMAIGEMVREISGIKEAYLPYCFADGIMEKPGQVLVLGVAPAADREHILDAIGKGLRQLMKPETDLNIWLLNEGDIALSSIRATRTHIHCPPPKKLWWRIFG